MTFYKMYIDPGTGSMLFAVLFSIIGALVFFLQGVFLKLKFKISGGKGSKNHIDKIPVVIFSDDKRYWQVFEPICKEFDSRDVDVVYYTASSDDPCLDNDYKHIKASFIGEGNKAFSKLNFLNANIVIATTPGLDVYQWKRSKNVDFYIHILHAAGDVTGYRMFGLDYYDAVLLSGKYQIDDIRELEKLRGLPEKELVITGIPYMDEMKKRLISNSVSDKTESETTVLLASSWGGTSILGRYGSTIIKELVKTGYKIIIRPHPQSFVSEKEMIDKLMSEFPESEKIEWNKDSDNFNVLKKSDIMISDFSGVILDFALVYNKPIIYADVNFDDSPYDAWWLKRPYWTIKVLPRLGEKLTQDCFSNIKETIDNCINNSVYAEGRDKTRSETWENMGEGAVRTVDYVLNKYTEITNAEKDI